VALVCATTATGQTPRQLPPISPEAASKAAAEASRVLEKARANRDAEIGRRAEVDGPIRAMDATVSRAKASTAGRPSYAEQAQQAESQQRFQDALRRVGPEGQAILAQNGATPTPVSPTGTKASPISTTGPGPKPMPLRATPITPTEKPPQRTDIQSNRLFFDPDKGFGVFVDDVVLIHPDFNLNSDELEIYMNKEQPKPGANGAAATAEAAGPTAGELAKENAAESAASAESLTPSQRRSGGNIKNAIARGRRVLITKLSPEGESQTGIGREAVYDGATGDIILRGMPQIQKGQSLTRAVEPTTYFVIKANGHFYAEGGRAQTIIVQDDEKKAPPPPAPSAGAVPSTTAVPALNPPAPGR
jgi:lipopolysaccharide export system protein LptA